MDARYLSRVVHRSARARSRSPLSLCPSVLSLSQVECIACSVFVLSAGACVQVCFSCRLRSCANCGCCVSSRWDAVAQSLVIVVVLQSAFVFRIFVRCRLARPRWRVSCLQAIIWAVCSTCNLCRCCASCTERLLPCSRAFASSTCSARAAWPRFRIEHVLCERGAVGLRTGGRSLSSW